jgi:hypothetical protein
MTPTSVIPTTEPASPQDRPRRPSSKPSPVAWIPTAEIDYREWASVGRRLGGIGRCSQWWIGDWVRYGSARWGERYAVAARITGYDAHSLRNMVWISSRFEPSRRRDNLTWSHHASLATLEPYEQDRWLDRAAAERLSVSDLRIELRSTREGGGDRSTSAGEIELSEPARTVLITCPQCGLEISTHVNGEEDGQ